jgi:hypothetical protein
MLTEILNYVHEENSKGNTASLDTAYERKDASENKMIDAFVCNYLGKMFASLLDGTVKQIKRLKDSECFLSGG